MKYLFPLITVCIWAGNTIVNKLAASSIEPSAMSFYRWLVAVFVLSPFCLPSIIKNHKKIRPYLMKLAFLSLIGMVIHQSLSYYAALTTTASNQALILSLVPLFAIFLSVPLLSKSISSTSILGGVIAISGLIFMLGKGDFAYLLHQDVTIGDILMIIASASYGAYCVLLKKWNMPLSNWTMVYLQGLFALLMLTPLWLTSNQLIPSPSSLPLIAYAGFGASILAPWLWVRAIKLIGADTSAMFMNLVPIFAMLMASSILGETVYYYHMIGGLLVLAGVVISQIKPRQKKSCLNHVKVRD